MSYNLITLITLLTTSLTFSSSVCLNKSYSENVKKIAINC